MAREKYETMLRCPVCDRTGLAAMSDDKSHKIGDYDTRIEAVTQGLEVKGKDVICSVCQVSALSATPNARAAGWLNLLSSVARAPPDACRYLRTIRRAAS